MPVPVRDVRIPGFSHLPIGNRRPRQYRWRAEFLLITHFAVCRVQELALVIRQVFSERVPRRCSRLGPTVLRAAGGLALQHRLIAETIDSAGCPLSRV